MTTNVTSASASGQTKTFSKKLHGVELFATGTWGGDTYTERDLDAMVSAFHSLPLKVPIKFGHDETQRWWGQRDGAPALGWVENVRRMGGKLIGDFDAVPDPVHAMIEAKRYRKVSAEIYWNYRDDEGRAWPRALKAVSLLGADLPAVTSLADLQTALHTEDRQFKVYDQRAESVRAYGDDKSGKEDTMDAEKVKEYTDRIAALTLDVAKATERADKAEERAVRAEAALANAGEEAAVAHFKEVTLPALKKEGKVLPAEEEGLIVTFHSLGSKPKKYGEKEVNPRDEFVKGLKARGKVVEFKETAAGGDDEKNTTAASVDEAIKAFCDANPGKTYRDGMAHVRASKPDLWKKYISG